MGGKFNSIFTSLLNRGLRVPDEAALDAGEVRHGFARRLKIPALYFLCGARRSCLTFDTAARTFRLAEPTAQRYEYALVDFVVTSPEKLLKKL